MRPRVVGINTSAMIEAAIVGRPGLLDSGARVRRHAGRNDSFPAPAAGKRRFLRLAATLDEHVAQLAGRLEDSRGVVRGDATLRPDRSSARTDWIGRPRRCSSTPRRPWARPAPRPRGLPVWAPLLWPVLWIAAAPAWIVDSAGGGTASAGRKRARGTHRGGKRCASGAARIGRACTRDTRWCCDRGNGRSTGGTGCGAR
jgi:hypothetical protein